MPTLEGPCGEPKTVSSQRYNFPSYLYPRDLGPLEWPMNLLPLDISPAHRPRRTPGGSRFQVKRPIPRTPVAVKTPPSHALFVFYKIQGPACTEKGRK